MRTDRELLSEMRAHSLADVEGEQPTDIHVMEVPSKEYALFVGVGEAGGPCGLCWENVGVTQIAPGVWLCAACDDRRFRAAVEVANA